MATIKFLIQSNKNPTGVYVRLRDGRSLDIKTRTQFIIDPADWSNKKGTVKHKKNEKLRLLDLQLHNLRSEILNLYNTAINTTPITTQWLKSILDPVKANKIPQTIVEYFDYYAENKKNQIAPSSYKKLLFVKNFITKYETKKKYKFLVGEINEKFMSEFLNEGLKQGYSQNYLSKNFGFIKTVCYDAELNGINIYPRLRQIKIKEVETPIIYLNPSELDLIEEVTLEREALINARDWLLISCETAQRVSDFIKYDANKIFCKKGESGKTVTLIEFTQKKTKTKMLIPLSKRVMQIINSRGGQFPRKISNQRYNEHIKEVARLAGITNVIYGGKQHPKTNKKVKGHYPKYELVTSHIGRRSFASNYYGKIPTPLIMAMTGHKTEKEFLKYIGKTESDKAMQLAEFII